MGFLKSYSSPLPKIPWASIGGTFDSDSPYTSDEQLLKWPNSKINLTFREAVRGIQIFGATGSGKTSGSGAYIAQNLLGKGIGGLVLTAKKDEYELWEKYARQTFSDNRLIRIDWSERYTVNIFEYFRQNSHDLGNVHIEIADLIRDLIFDINRTENDSFWTKARDLLLTNIIQGLVNSSSALTISNIAKAVKELYLLRDSEEEAHLIKRIASGSEDLNDYFYVTLKSLAEETFSSMVMTLEVQIGRYVNSKAGKLLMEETNIDPRLMIEGAIFLIDTPLEKYGAEGELICKLWKSVFEKMVLKFKDNNSRITFKWEDESHNFVTKRDAFFNSTSRDKNQINVYCTQGLNNYLLDSSNMNEKAASSLLTNIGTKIFHQSSESKSYELLRDIAGKVDIEKKRVHSAKGKDDSITTEKHKEDKVQRDQLLALKKGGKRDKFKVEALVSMSGREWDIMSIQFCQKYIPKRNKSAAIDFTSFF